MNTLRVSEKGEPGVQDMKPNVRKASKTVRDDALRALEAASISLSAYMTHAGHVSRDDHVVKNLMRATQRWQIVNTFGENPDDAEALHRWQQERENTRRIRRATRQGD